MTMRMTMRMTMGAFDSGSNARSVTPWLSRKEYAHRPIAQPGLGSVADAVEAYTVACAG
jgi:hypothetical protein